MCTQNTQEDLFFQSWDLITRMRERHALLYSDFLNAWFWRNMCNKLFFNHKYDREPLTFTQIKQLAIDTYFTSHTDE